MKIYDISQELFSCVVWPGDPAPEKQILNWSYRHNCRQRNMQAEKIPKRKGRPRTHPLTTAEEYEREIARLEMENKLLRDFLQLTERK